MLLLLSYDRAAAAEVSLLGNMRSDSSFHLLMLQCRFGIADSPMVRLAST